MRNVNSTRYLLLASLLVSIGVAYAVLSSPWDQDASGEIVILKDVSDLDENGVSLTLISDASAAITRAEAEAKVVQAHGDVSVKETVPVHIVWNQGKREHDAWAVNLDPESYPFFPGSGTGVYAVEFIDMATGEFLLSLSKELPPPGGWDEVPDFEPLPTQAAGEVSG
jgi:hypothetical protein